MSLGYGDDGFGVGDSPRPGERAEDPRHVDQRPRMTDAEYLANVKRWGEVAKAFRRIPECAKALDLSEPNFFNHVDVVFRLGGKDVRREADVLFRALHAALSPPSKPETP